MLILLRKSHKLCHILLDRLMFCEVCGDYLFHSPVFYFSSVVRIHFEYICKEHGQAQWSLRGTIC